MIGALWAIMGTYHHHPKQMNGHHSDIQMNKVEKPAVAHFYQSDHSPGDLEVRGIEKIHDDNMLWRRERESHPENPGIGGNEPG